MITKALFSQSVDYELFKVFGQISIFSIKGHEFRQEYSIAPCIRSKMYLYDTTPFP